MKSKWASALLPHTRSITYCVLPVHHPSLYGLIFIFFCLHGFRKQMGTRKRGFKEASQWLPLDFTNWHKKARLVPGCYLPHSYALYERSAGSYLLPGGDTWEDRFKPVYEASGRLHGLVAQRTL